MPEVLELMPNSTITMTCANPINIGMNVEQILNELKDVERRINKRLDSIEAKISKRNYLEL